MKTRFFFFALFLFSFSFLTIQSQIPPLYTSSWKRVDSLVGLGQPKSAMEIVNSIMDMANNEKNDPQYIKAIIYRIRLNSEFQENFLVCTIRELRQACAVSAQPVRQILHSILGEVYWKYYQNNAYRFQDRTQVKQNSPDDIETWDLNTILGAITSNYLSSIENETLLQNISIDVFDAIIEKSLFEEGKKDPTPEFRPTLFDFLAHRALDYFSADITIKNLPVDAFQVDRTEYFGLTREFIKTEITPTKMDSISPRFISLLLFQKLATFHLNDKTPQALIDVELDRFHFLLNSSIIIFKDNLYLESLKKFEQVYLYSPWSTDISYAIASFYEELGQQYQPLVSNQYKWYNKKALDYCQDAIRRFPESEGSAACRNLEKLIRRPLLQISSENAVPSELPSLALLKYKNITRLSFRLIKLNPDKFEEQKAGMNDEQLFKLYGGMPFVNTWSLELPSDGDYQAHRTEIRIPEVKAGKYLFFVSADSSFSDNKIVFAWVSFWSTRLSYISQRNKDGSIGVFILDRVTGKPLKKVQFEKFSKNYNYQERNYVSRKMSEGFTDNDGYILLPAMGDGARQNNFYLKLKTRDDVFLTENFYQYPVQKTAPLPYLKTWFYTDRAIYRPGQIVYFKGIVLQNTGNEFKIKANHSTKIVFLDVNGMKISEQSLKTNDFGSFNGSFTIPQEILLGNMSINNESGSVSISVEEYKRPTFDVIFEPMEGNYRLGSLISVTGNALSFAGNKLDQARVRYRVVRSARFPWIDSYWQIPMPVSQVVEITNGMICTDTAGNFKFVFSAIPDLNVSKETKPVFNYAVYVDITDINGETQTAQNNVSIGYQSLFLELNIPEKVNLDQDSVFKLTAKNLNGRLTPTEISFSLYRLQHPSRIFKLRMWDQPDIETMNREIFYRNFPNDIYQDENNPLSWPQTDTILEMTFDTGKDTLFNLPFQISRISHTFLRPGFYLIVMKAKDPFGDSCIRRLPVTIFSPSSRNLPVNALGWFVPLKVRGNPGDTARFLVGSKASDVNILYEIRAHDTLYSREWIEISGQQKLIEIPIKETFRGNFSVNFFFIRLNRAFQYSQVVNVPYSDKKLTILVENFRNKLLPGTQEEWKIRISDSRGLAPGAEFLSTLYDASLDALVSHSWSFDLFQHYFSSLPWNFYSAFHTDAGSWKFSSPVIQEYLERRQFGNLNWFGLGYFGYGTNRRYDSKGVLQAQRLGLSESPIMALDNRTETTLPVSPPVQQESGDKEETQTIPSSEILRVSNPVFSVRRDFRETAFFYPSLVTDSSGSLFIHFTVPESLTEWKFMGLAHTKDLKWGMVEKELVTQKELMVFPNVPRFIRQGDTVIFSTKIVNLVNRDLRGEIRLELVDALTMKSLDSIMILSNGPIHGQESVPLVGSPFITFILAADQSTSVSWKIKVPVRPDLSVLQYRITAKAENFSDGEEQAIPVLTNRMLVTESLPLPVRGRGSFDFTFEKLLRSAENPGRDSTRKNYRLTLEFASNPAWYAIQALPALNEKTFDHADAIFASMYSNSLASFIANSSPVIRKVFESWKDLTPEALTSNLEKNQQLKSALLRETPWVIEAINDRERKQKLAQYFDLNNLRANLEQNKRKLQKLQSSNGGWAWFEGMRENRFITQNILIGLGRLFRLGIDDIRKDADIRKMIINAIRYLDYEAFKDYEKIKKEKPESIEERILNVSDVQYLYARSFFMDTVAENIGEKSLPRSIELTSETRDAFEYFIRQAIKNWISMDKNSQGMIALTLNRLGKKETAGFILKSLSEKALHSVEMGMYWAQPQGWYWYQAPVETQALLIDVFDEVGHDLSSVEEMKIWLLKQKQTQDWKTTRATLEACSALILHGTDMLIKSPETKITIGKKKIDSENLKDINKEAGTGYFQVSWSGEEIRPDMGVINIVKSTEGVAWGAVYWQYFDNLDKITQAQIPLKVEKRLFLQKNTPVGQVLLPLEDNTNIHVGDRVIVRIVVTADRDFEFVHMKDMRAAAFEPVEIREKSFISGTEHGFSQGEGTGSGYRYQEGLGFYQTTTDQSMNFFFDYIAKGIYVFEYPLKANSAGDYSNGITTIQCMYAPEFSGHSEGIRINILP